MITLKSIMSRRLAAIAILAVVLVVFSSLVILPVAKHVVGLQEQLGDQRRILGRLTQLAEPKAFAVDLASRLKQARNRGVFLEGDTDALRTAKLQSLLATEAKKVGIRIRTSRTLSSIERDGIQLLGVEVLMGANIQQIRSMLVNIEQQWPYLFVHSLGIGQPTSRQPNDDKLEFRIGVFGVVAQFVDEET